MNKSVLIKFLIGMLMFFFITKCIMTDEIKLQIFNKTVSNLQKRAWNSIINGDTHQYLKSNKLDEVFIQDNSDKNVVFFNTSSCVFTYDSILMNIDDYINTPHEIIILTNFKDSVDFDLFCKKYDQQFNTFINMKGFDLTGSNKYTCVSFILNKDGLISNALELNQAYYDFKK